MADLSIKIKQVENFHKKTLDNAKKNLLKAIDDLNENLPKLMAGAKQLEEVEQNFMAGGIEAAAKKSRMLFRATKTLGDYARYVQAQLNEFPEKIDRKQVENWKFEDFKDWLKTYNKLINNIDIERKKANDIMGLDHAIKRRVTEGPLNKLVYVRNTLSDLLCNEWQIIKALEDLYNLEEEIDTTRNSIENLLAQQSELENQIINFTQKKDSFEKEIHTLEEQGQVKVYREFKIHYQSKELEIGHQINPFKKSFRLLGTKGSNLKDVGSFEIMTAKNYEDDVIGTFYSDVANDFRNLSMLCQALVNHADELDLKGTQVHRMKQLQQSIADGKLKRLYLEVTQTKEKMKELEKDPILVKDLEIIEQKRQELNQTQEYLEKEQFSLDNIKSKLIEENETEKLRLNRFDELVNEAMKPLQPTS